jgi:hypothetical protein
MIGCVVNGRKKSDEIVRRGKPVVNGAMIPDVGAMEYLAAG